MNAYGIARKGWGNADPWADQRGRRLWFPGLISRCCTGSAPAIDSGRYDPQRAPVK